MREREGRDDGDASNSSPSFTPSSTDETLVTEPRRSRASGRLPRGSSIGRYVVLRPLGSGGMGVVYSAYDPELDRKIAIKLLHSEDGASIGGTDGRARLLREAQALARLSHPNVVAVHDVGEHAGQVFVAMEFIEGATFSAWLARPDRDRKDWRSALDILIAAGRGLAAAHEKGMVHRDFKPDNVMIDEEGRVRVLDFGLARARAKSADASTDPRVDAENGSLDPLDSEITRAGATPGTPAYMSPEQHLGEDLDAASDQFSFCVAAYEAVYGQRPFAGSTAVALSIATAGGKVADPPPGIEVPRALRRVLLRGLARHPSERWPSMHDLLAQLERDPTRSRRRAYAFGAVALLALGAFGAFRLERARTLQTCEAAGAEIGRVWNDDVRAALRRELLASQAPYAQTTAEQVERWFDLYATEWSEARTRTCLGATQGPDAGADIQARASGCLDERRQALESLVSSLRREDVEQLPHAVAAAAGLPPVAQCEDLAWLASRTPRPREADAAAEAERIERLVLDAGIAAGLERHPHAVELATEAVGAAEMLAWQPLVGRARFQLGSALDGAGDYEAAQSTMVEAYLSAIKAGDDELAARAASMAAYVLGTRLARTDEGDLWARMADASLERSGSADGLVRANYFTNLGGLEFAAGHYARSREFYADALALRRDALGNAHPQVGSALSNLGVAAAAAGDVEAGLTSLNEAVALIEAALGPDHPGLSSQLISLARLQVRTGDREGAERTMRRALAIREAALPVDHPDIAKSLVNLANTVEDPEERRALLERALPVLEASMGPEHPWVGGTLNNLALLHSDAGNPAKALPLLERALAMQEASQGPEHPTVALMLRNIASARRGLGEFDEAEKNARRALAIREKVLGANHPDVADSLTQVGETLLGAGRPSDAISWLERALALHVQVASDAESLGKCRFSLARAMWDAKRDRPRARVLANEARADLEQAEDADEALEAVDAWLAAHPDR